MEVRRKHQALYEAAESPADKEKYAKSIARPTPELINALTLRIIGEGFSYMVAPREADAQLALLAREGITDFTLSSDQDMVIHGVYRLVYKWDASYETAHFLSLHGGLNAALRAHSDAMMLENLLAPLSELHRMRALRVLAVAAGCDYFHLLGTAIKSALEALVSCRALLGRADVSQDTIVQRAIEWLFANKPGVSKSQLSLASAVQKAQLAACAFEHAPAFSARLNKVVLLSGLAWDALPLVVREYLGFSLPDLNVDPVGSVLGGEIAGNVTQWTLNYVGHAYVSFPCPSMFPHALASAVEPVESCQKAPLEAYLRARQLQHTGTVAELLERVAAEVRRDRDAIERPRGLLTGDTNLFALRLAAGADRSKMTQLDQSIQFPAMPSAPHPLAGGAAPGGVSARAGVSAGGASAPSASTDWVFRLYGRDPDEFHALPMVKDDLLWRHWEQRELHPHMRPLVRGDAVARMLTFEQVRPLVWASKKGGLEHWVHMPIPASMASREYIIQICLRSGPATTLPAAQLPASMSTSVSFTRIIRAICICDAGTCGGCWHVACVLIVLRDILRGDIEDASPTSKLCRWIMPSVRWMLQPGRAVPIAQLLRLNLHARKLQGPPRLQWNTDVRLAEIGGRAAVMLPQRERDAPRDSPAKVAARTALYDALREVYGEPCASEYAWDTPLSELEAWRAEVTERTKAARRQLLSGAASAGAQVAPPQPPVVLDGDGDNDSGNDALDLLADAVKFEAMRDRDLQDACNVYAQKHPTVAMPPVAGGPHVSAQGAGLLVAPSVHNPLKPSQHDYAQQFVCPWHGPIIDLHTRKWCGT